MTKKAQQPKQPSPETRETRESFLPQAESSPPAEVLEMAAPTKPDQRISLVFERLDERSVRLTLTIPPLRPCVVNMPIPLNASPEQHASRLAAALLRAAAEAEADGIYQHAEKQRIEAESRDRYAKR